MPSNDQQENVLSSAPSLPRALFFGFLGLLPLAVVGWMGITGGLGLAGTVGLPFLGFGGWFWWKAYKLFRRRRIYGTSYLQLESVPVTLGSSLRARLRAPISADDQFPNGLDVRTAAIWGRREDNKEVVWEDRTSVRGQPGAGETEVPFSLDLPVNPLPDDWTQMTEGPPLMSMKNQLEDLNWTVEVTVSLDDKLDYEASFEFPVSVPDNPVPNDLAPDDPLPDHLKEENFDASSNSGGGYIANR